MGDEREFKIKITTAADTSGAKQTAAELDNISPKTQKYIQSLKDGGGAAEHMEVSHRNLRFGLRMLGPDATAPLQPGEDVTVTYSVGTPVMTWKPF